MKKVQQTKRSVFLILAAIMLFACNKSNDMETQDGYYLDFGLEFSIFNSQNEDLLNPENPNHLDVSKIKLFYLINGEKQEVYDPNMDSPRNFFIFQHENEYRIRVFLNHTETSEKPITYIQWNNNDTDTLEVVYDRSPNAIRKNKIWLNGEPIWERGDNTTDAYFVLTK